MWPLATELETDRFILEPLTVAHADAMVAVLASPELYTFTGGEPPHLEELRSRYTRQAAGHSPADDAGWLNWIILTKDSGQAIGYVQATVTRDEDGLVADLAWLVGPKSQGKGAASESASAVVDWLAHHGATHFRALIRPDHEASAQVAQHLGLERTATVIDGEALWVGSRT